MTKILVVEDNEENMYLVTFILEKNGHEVVQAWNGEEAIERASKEKPSLILMDIKMPGIDGYEATRRIKEMDGCEEIPIVAITSYAMKNERDEALDAGCIRYLEKPIDPRTFVKTVKECIG